MAIVTAITKLSRTPIERRKVSRRVDVSGAVFDGEFADVATECSAGCEVAGRTVDTSSFLVLVVAHNGPVNASTAQGVRTVG